MYRLYKIVLFYVLLITCYLLLGSPILASNRNIFGLHLTQTSDINSASTIINSAGGDWGWVTITLRPDQLDYRTWQDFFDNCRKLHLIPIIRLAGNIQPDGNWTRPSLSDIDNFAAFLNSLIWPTRQQHLILFNEINRSNEWGGSVDIKNYTDIAIYAIEKFKTTNPNFFILGSPLDLAAPEKAPQYKSAANVYHEIFLYKPQYFYLLDGLASHSYPNHGYIGKPNESGQHSIKGYQWELSYLKSLGVTKNYPVFITETGWPHRQGETNDNHYFTVETSAAFLETALNIWNSDDRIEAVTPFIYNYPYLPFDHFSWLDKNAVLYPQYQRIIDLAKNKANPEQITKYEFVKINLPFLILVDHEYAGEIQLKNTGQSIWGETKFCLNPQTTINVTLDLLCLTSTIIYPGQTATLPFKFQLHSSSDLYTKTFISWDDLPPFEIKPIVFANSVLYHPQTGFFEKIADFFSNLIK